MDEICVYGESRNRRLKGLIAECQRVGLSIRRVERSHLDTLSGGGTHQDVVVLLNSTAAEKLPWSSGLTVSILPPFVLILVVGLKIRTIWARLCARRMLQVFRP